MTASRGSESVCTQNESDHPLPARVLEHPRFNSSRRIVVLGVAGLATIALGGCGLDWFPRAQQPNPAVATRPAPTSPPSATTSSGAMFGFDLQHTHFNPYERIISSTNVSRLVLHWTGEASDRLITSPTVANGVVYLGGGDGKVYAFDAASGHLLWASATGRNVVGNAGVSMPAVTNGVVYVGSDDGRFYAFDAASGQLRWKTPAYNMASIGGIYSNPAVVNEVVYVSSPIDGNLYAFHTSTGQILWRALVGKGDSMVSSSPAIVDGIIYVGAGDGKVHAFDASSGRMIWKTPVLNNKPFEPGFLTSPAVVNGIIYILGEQLYALHADNGQLLWTAPTTKNFLPGSSPAVAYGRVYVNFAQGLMTFDANSGQLLWTAGTAHSLFTDTTVANGVVYICNLGGDIYAFDANSGQQLWTGTAGDYTNNAPTIANGVLYLGCGDHKLYAFHLQ